jgi:hypothetical protein
MAVDRNMGECKWSDLEGRVRWGGHGEKEREETALLSWLTYSGEGREGGVKTRKR